MSKLAETAKSYRTLARLLDQEVRKRSGPTSDLERQREALNVAFYLLGWAQFEYLVRKETEATIDRESTTKSVAQLAWLFWKRNSKAATVRQRLDLIFHSRPAVRSGLDKDYDVRNDAAHDYRMLPQEAKDVGAFIDKLEALVDDF